LAASREDDFARGWRAGLRSAVSLSRRPGCGEPRNFIASRPLVTQPTTARALRPASLPRRDRGVSAWAERHFKWLMVAPAVALILALSIYPLLFSLWVNFVNYDFQIPGHAFVGLQNFAEVVNDPLWWSSLLVTVGLSLTVVTIEFILGLALALAMVEMFRGRGIVMSILIIPLFISPVIVGQSWALFLQRPFGPADYLLSQLLGRAVTISWVGEVPWVYFAIVIADVWQWTPFMFVILLAGLAAIPPHLYEAAELDGVSHLQTFRYVTLPQLAPIILLAITFRLLDSVKLFDIIFMLTGGGPGTATYTASFYLYQIGFQQFHLSIATAGSWLFLILLAVVIMAVVRRLLRAEAA
jgi:multiple sugar transport system permease protein